MLWRRVLRVVVANELSSYDDFPVNANSAEARRRSRFFPFGHTQGQIEEPRLVIGRDHPRTLDLRRFTGA